MAYLLFLALAPVAVSAGQFRSSRNQNGFGERFVQTMTNEGDAQYTVKMSVGGQTFRTIPDTGSFDLLLFSSECTSCGSNLYERGKSSTYEAGGLKADQYFGSGTTFANEAFEAVHLGIGQSEAANLKVDRQMFWEVYDADMPILESSTYQSILGVGPPSSVVEMALQEADQVRSTMADMKQNGQTSAYNDLSRQVDNYMNVAEHARSQSTLVAGLAMRAFSVCLRPQPGSDGVWTWNDAAFAETPDMFTTVNVVGDMYWSTVLTDVALGKPGSAQETLTLGCAGGSKCSAVLDTGTSFIVMPEEAYLKVEESVLKWSGQVGPCPDLSTLPNLEFKLNGESFTLPPESYLGEMRGDVPVHLQAMVPRGSSLRRMPASRYNQTGEAETEEVRCAPLLLTMDQTDEEPTFILGQPFFRKYYSTFLLAEGSMKAEKMAFAHHDEDCRPSRGEELLRRPRPVIRRPLQVDVSKLQLPRGVKVKRHML